MKSTTTSICSLLTLSATAGVLLWSPGAVRTAAADPAPTELRLNGIVRDFWSTHSDFKVVPSAGPGHYAGSVQETLGPDGVPLFQPGGCKVSTEWTDGAGRNISSHLYSDQRRPRLVSAQGFRMESDCFVDSFDSRQGAYGGANVSQDASLRTNAVAANAVNLIGSTLFNGSVWVGVGGSPDTVISNTSRVTGTTTALDEPVVMPVIPPPAGVGANLGNQTFSGGSHLINSSRHWGDLRIDGGAIITFDGEITILVDGSVDIDDYDVQFVFLPGATLKLYCTDWMEIDNDAQINVNTGDPSRLTIYMTGTYDGSGDEEEAGLVDVEDGAQINADIIAPNGKILLDNGCDVFGTFVGQSVEINDNSRYHVDLAVFSTGCDSGDGSLGSTGPPSTAGVASAASFAEWFNDTPTVNQSAAHSITLVENSGVYEYITDAFSPIDDRLWGNEGDPHNHYFTYTLEADFAYTACGGQFVEFEGGDGTWVFVDDQLGTDLGGMLAGKQYLEIDKLGLTDGQTYRLRLFYAQRQPFQRRFRLRTNIELSTDAVLPSVTTAYD